MSVKIKTLDDYGFLFCFIGGAITILTSILYLIVNAAGARVSWFFGGGFIGLANYVAGAIITLVVGIFALIIGLKIISVQVRNMITKIDLIITSLVIILIAIIVFGLGGLLILIGGILIMVYRLLPEGNANPMGK